MIVESWPELDRAALRGLAGDVVSEIEPHTEADRAGLLASFAAMFGSAVGSGPHARVGAVQHPARLFIANTGKTSRARKGTATAEIRPIIEQADPGWSSRVLGGFGSGEKVVDEVSDGTEDKPAALDRRLCVREPELARLLRVAARDGSTLSPIIREAWDGGRLAVRTRQSTVTATGAHVSIVADITVEELRRCLVETDALNGFANRFLFVACRRSKRLPSGGNLDDAVVSELAGRVRHALEAGRRRNRLHRTPEAEAYWAEIYDAIDDEVDGLFGAATARAEAQMLRLQLIYSLLDQAQFIESEHVDAAHAFWRYCEASARIVFGGRFGDEVVDRLYDALEVAGDEGLTVTEQYEVFGRHVTKSRLDAARSMLEERGLVVTVEQPTSGRPQFRSFLVDAKEANLRRKVTASSPSFANSLSSQVQDDDWITAGVPS